MAGCNRAVTSLTQSLNMWPRRVCRAVPDKIHAEFERHGESVVAQALAFEPVPGRDPLSFTALSIITEIRRLHGLHRSVGAKNGRSG